MMKKCLLLSLLIFFGIHAFAQRELTDCQKMRTKRHEFAEQSARYLKEIKNGSTHVGNYTDTLSQRFKDLDDYYVYMSKQTGDEGSVARVYRYENLGTYLSYLGATNQYQKLLETARANSYTINQGLYARDVTCKSVAEYKTVYTYAEDEYGNIMATGKKVPELNSIITIPQNDIEISIGNVNFAMIVAAGKTGNFALRDSLFLDAYLKNVFASPGPFNFATGRYMISQYSPSSPLSDIDIKGAIVTIGGYPSRAKSIKEDTVYRPKAIMMIQNRWMSGLQASKDDIVTNTEALRLIIYTGDLKAEKLYQMLKGNFTYLKEVSQFYQKNGASATRAYNTIGPKLAEELFHIDDKTFLNNLIEQFNLYKQSLEMNNVALLYTAYKYCRDNGDKETAKELYRAISGSKTKYPQYPK